MMVVILMMATGTTDPVRRATDASWEDTIKGLTAEGSTEDGAGIYCDVNGGDDCNTWYGPNGADDPHDGCDSTPLELWNCTSLTDGTRHADCPAKYLGCVACSEACKEAVITSVKDNILPASYFVFVLCFFLVICVVWNNILIASDEMDGITKILGLVINGIVVLFSFILIILASYAASAANTTCENAGQSDCIPGSLWFLIFVGVALLATGAVVMAGIQMNNGLLVRVGTLVMVFLSLICLLTGLIMGISSGAVMDDMQFYYDSNYPRLRAALENQDNSFCKLRHSDCLALAKGDATKTVYAQICDDPETADGCEAVEGSPAMRRSDVWQNMWSAAMLKSKDAAFERANTWIEACETSGICIFCKDVYEDVQDVSTVVAGEMTINLKGAVIQTGAAATEVRWAGSLTAHTEGTTTAQILKCASTATTMDGTAPACTNAQSTYPARANACDGADRDACTGPPNTGQCTWDDTDGCATILGPMPTAGGAGWADAIFNYTLQKPASFRGAVGKCEEALIKHTSIETDDAGVVTSDCKGKDAVPAADVGTYLADCDYCNTDTPFTFTGTVRDADLAIAEERKYCLSYFVGHYNHVCAGVAGDNACQNEFWEEACTGPGVCDNAAHAKVMVDSAYRVDEKPDKGTVPAEEKPTAFCGYTDEACKAKIKETIEGSMSVIGYVGLVFVIFFIAIMFLTLQGIKIYKGGGDDGDDDDDSDGDDSDE